MINLLKKKKKISKLCSDLSEGCTVLNQVLERNFPRIPHLDLKGFKSLWNRSQISWHGKEGLDKSFQVKSLQCSGEIPTFEGWPHPGP